MLSRNIKYIYPDIMLGPNSPVQLVDDNDGRGMRIAAWGDPRPQPTAAEIEAAALPATKSQRITAINTECRDRLLARFGDPAEQVSRAIGVYGLAEKAALETGIAATIDASNTASDAVIAATTIEAVEAVAVAWPVI